MRCFTNHGNSSRVPFLTGNEFVMLKCRLNGYVTMWINYCSAWGETRTHDLLLTSANRYWNFWIDTLFSSSCLVYWCYKVDCRRWMAHQFQCFWFIYPGYLFQFMCLFFTQETEWAKRRILLFPSCYRNSANVYCSSHGMALVCG